MNRSFCLKILTLNKLFCKVNSNNQLIKLATLSTLKNSPTQLKTSLTPEIKNTIKFVTDLYNIRPFKAAELISNCKQISKTDSSLITSNFELCCANKITRECLLLHPEIICTKDLNEKIKELKNLPYKLNDTACMAQLNLNLLKLLTKSEQEERRIEQLSELLKVDAKVICSLIAKRSFLITLNLNEVKTIVKLLEEYGIGTTDILTDLWVLKYSYNQIKERLDLAKSNNVENFKTWMVRVQPYIFENYLKRRTDNKLILGNNSLIEYLSERLACSQEVTKYLISKHPALKNKSLTKMQEIIDFLYSKGFKPIHICRVPKILLHSVETTKKRLKELESQGMHLDSLYILTKSQKQYMQFYEALEKANKKLKGKQN